ncbi:MAG: NADH dehydrogenase [Planctomycetota bacterium]|nr:MAG: NADH dehydrogenase [Planctomycetota bacterium]
MSDWMQEIWTFIHHPLMFPMVVTALAGLIAYMTARRAADISRFVSLIACVVVLVLTYRLFAGDFVELDVTWLALNDLNLSIAMSNGKFGSLIAMGAAFFGLLIAISAIVAEKGEAEEGRFYAFLCWTLTGAIGAALADDLIWLLICWELVTLCLYMLLNLGKGDSPTSAAKTFGMIGFGDAAMLLAMVLIGATEGTFRINELSIEVDSPLTYICFILFMIAALAKAGAVPMHTWIPTAATDASAHVMALLPASLDKLLGIYLLATFSLRVFTLDTAMRAVLMIIGAVTILAAVMMAMNQHHLKKLLSFHAVSQVGYMVLGIGTGVPIGIAGGIFHMINHSIYKSCLFLTAGAVERQTGTSEMNRLGGLARVLPVTFMCCTIAALAISGIPPLNGFVSKWLVYQGCLSAGSPLAILCLVAAVFGSALTLASFVKVLATVFWGPATTDVAPSGGVEGNGKFALALPMVVLAVLCLGFGIFAQWPLNNLVIPALVDVGVPQTPLIIGNEAIEVSGLSLWGPVPATMLILLGVLGGIGLYLVGKVAHVRVANSFVGGEVLDDESVLKFPATSFYRTVEDMPGLGQALSDGGQGVYDVYRLGGRYGGSLVEVLRNLHSGVLSLYVSWCLVGVVIIALYLMAVL